MRLLALSLLAAVLTSFSLTSADEPSPLDSLDAMKIPAKLRPPKSAPPETLVELGLRDGRWDTLAVRPDGKRLAASAPDGTVMIWSLPELKLATRLKHPGIVALAYSPDGKTLAATDAKGNLRLWTIGSPASPRALLQQIHKGGPAWSLAWSPDGKTLATAGQDKVIKIWDARPARPVLKATIAAHEKVVRQLAFSPDGTLLASAGSSDKVAKLWDLSGAKPVQKAEMACEGPVASVSFSPDGKALATASYDSKVRIWKLDEDKPAAELTVDMGQKAVRVVQFSPDGKSFAVLLPSDMGEKIAIRGRDGSKIRDWSFLNHVQGMTFAPDGRHFATANEDSVYLLRLK